MALPEELVALMAGGASAEDVANRLYDDNLMLPPEVEAPKYELTASDLLSPTWKKLRATLQADLVSLRIQNDNPNLGPIDTANLRGKINQVKALLALDKTTNQQADIEAPELNPGY